jgi:ABC-type bacteriocin/lantibiotic exporter with double-glycine peptidase domain
LSSESIQSNILFGATLDPQLLNEVLEQSQLTEWVSTLPKGVETTIGEFGNKISGGQRQRIAIARALYKRAKLIVFDEATTGLDETTKSAILETIIDLSQQKTIVIVSHDTSVTKHCRKILTIHNGQISA